MKCTKCGYKFDEGLFCPECGTKFDETVAERIEEEKAKKAEIERQTEIKRKEEEKEQAKIRKREEAIRQEELRKQQEIKRKEEKEKREVELAKAKAEQERLAKERVEKEVELLREKNEAIKIEQELAAKKELSEKQKVEELSRTFNGQVYNTVEEMKLAKDIFDKEELNKKQVKKADFASILSFILGIATYPLILTYVLWFPAMIISIIFGIIALKEKTEKKGLAITGLVLNIPLIVIIIAGIVIGIVTSS